LIELDEDPRGRLEIRGLEPFREAAAIGLFVLSYIGIAISLYPMIVPHHFMLWQAAASEGTQAFPLIGTLVLLPVILMYSGWSYWVFRGKVRSDVGYDWDVSEARR
jgi:cytochrome d ubiquinol oxidase subunit II